MDNMNAMRSGGSVLHAEAAPDKHLFCPHSPTGLTAPLESGTLNLVLFLFFFWLLSLSVCDSFKKANHKLHWEVPERVLSLYLTVTLHTRYIQPQEVWAIPRQYK